MNQVPVVDRSAPVQSPFLPGTKIQFAWDSTSLGMLKTCPRLYQYIMLDGWSAKDESVHLRFGQEFHTALEEYDKHRVAGGKHEEALRKVVKDLIIRSNDFDPDPTIRSGKYKSPHNLRQLVIDYLDKYQNDPAETFILQDGRPAVELSFRFELDWGPNGAVPHRVNLGSDHNMTGQPYILSGHLDRVVTFQSSLFVMDRKTAMTTLGDYYFDQFEPHNQMSLYTLASRIVLNSPVRGVIIDAAQILLEKPNEFRRGFTFRTPDQLDEWLVDLRVTLAEAEGYATNNYWPQRDTSCGMYGGCQFRKICSKSPQVREKFLKANFTQKPEGERWNPLKPR